MTQRNQRSLGRAIIFIILLLIITRNSTYEPIHFGYLTQVKQQLLGTRISISYKNWQHMVKLPGLKGSLNGRTYRYLYFFKNAVISIDNTLRFSKLRFISNYGFDYNNILSTLFSGTLLKQQLTGEYKNSQTININSNLFTVWLYITSLQLLFFIFLVSHKTKKDKFFNQLRKRVNHFFIKGKLILHRNKSNPRKQKHLTQNLKYQKIFQQLEETLESKQLFLDPRLSQQDVIKYIGTNRNYLYQAIKVSSKYNFSYLINSYRVKYAQDLIKEKLISNEKIVISDLFSSCGYSTNESFYRIFKNITGITPGEYVNGLTNNIICNTDSLIEKTNKPLSKSNKETLNTSVTSEISTEEAMNTNL